MNFAIVYDNGTGGIGTGVVSSNGQTFTRVINEPNAANGFTLEVWECPDYLGGGADTITWTGSSAVKAKRAIVELDQVAPVSPIDGTSTPLDKTTHRIDTTSSVSRTSAATSSVKRVGMIECFIGFIGWNDTRTISAAGSTWTGLAQLNGGSSNLGIGIERKNAEVKNVTGVNGIARFTMSGVAGTVPAAVACLAYFRDGVVTSTDDDGWIDNIEGTPTVYTTTTPDFLYRSSTSAPNGGTGASEWSTVHSRFPRLYRKAGVTLPTTFTQYYSVSDGFDEGNGYIDFAMYGFPTDVFGASLDAGDQSWGEIERVSMFTDPTVAGEHPVTLTTAYSYNDSGYCWTVMAGEGDTGGFAVSTYGNINEYSNNAPQYRIFALTYPVLSALKDPVITAVGGVVPFPR